MTGASISCPSWVRAGPGSDFTFGRFCLDARRYLKVRPAQVLALQSYFLIQTGEPPFWRMGMLGGEDGLRGYYLGRSGTRTRSMFRPSTDGAGRLEDRAGGLRGTGGVAEELDGFTPADSDIPTGSVCGSSSAASNT